VLDASLELVRAEGWMAFQPFPEAVRAEVALGCGEPQLASALLTMPSRSDPARGDMRELVARAALHPTPRSTPSWPSLRSRGRTCAA
jgi:hypothetical protein